MNTPNKLTLLRLIFVPFYVFFLLMPTIPHHYLAALLFFGAAAYTDHLDGKIAREQNMITDFGKFADPLADKIMVLAAFACFVQLGFTNAVVLILIVAREFAVTSIRLMAALQGKVIAANNWGKFKTVSQIISVLAVMLMQYVLELNSTGVVLIDNVDSFSAVFALVGEAFMWITAVITLISGVIYIAQNIELIKNIK